MATRQIEVPSVGESVKEGVLTSWLVKDGAQVHEGADLYELETDKATMAAPSPATGMLPTGVPDGSEVKIGQVVGEIDLAAIAGSGKGGRLTRGDVLAAVGRTESPPEAPEAPPAAPSPSGPPAQRRERMSSQRRSVARRLVDAKTLTAHLTTFGEVDMERIVGLRASYQESFQARHGIKLGLMSFFIKASCHALAEFPVLNAMIDGEDVVYNDVRDIGVAVSTERGLVVPVIRDADRKSLAELEKALADLAARARSRKILPDELAGGTFTITNGGVFGSLLSTPIINYPQSAILGLHAIQQRPVVVAGQIVARPMIYLAPSCDDRLIDGGADEKAMDMVRAIGSRENARPWVENAPAKKQKVPGMGHREH